jgi:hypothetical protein
MRAAAMIDLPLVGHGARPMIGRAAGRVANVEADPLVERLRRPIHVGALLGLSTGLYATTLAGVAILEQRADDQVAAARAPALAQVDELRRMNERLAATLTALSDRERTLAADYEALRSGVDATESGLADLAGVVGQVRGAAAALPQRIALPPVPRAAGVHAASTPAHATTGGS